MLYEGEDGDGRRGEWQIDLMTRGYSISLSVSKPDRKSISPVFCAVLTAIGFSNNMHILDIHFYSANIYLHIYLYIYIYLYLYLYIYRQKVRPVDDGRSVN